MKTGWQTTTLGEICQLEIGKPLALADRKSDGLYPVYGASGEVDRTDKYYFDKPTIVVGREGAAGALNLTEARFWPLDATWFVTFDEERYDLRFLYYLLATLDLPGRATGARPGLDRDQLYAQAVMAPALPEQQRIAGILDAAFDGIELAHANTVQSLQNARSLDDSHPHGIDERGRAEALRKQIQHLESLYLRKLAALDELKKLLLHQAFSGHCE